MADDDPVADGPRRGLRRVVGLAGSADVSRGELRVRDDADGAADLAPATAYGRHRAFWFGFVVFGWGYALLAFAPGAWTQIRPHLITSHPLGDLADALKLTTTSSHRVFGDPNYYAIIMDAGLNPWFATVEGDRFQRIGHSFAAILHGVAGGLLAVLLARRNGGVGSAIADHPTSKAIAKDGPH